MHWPDSRLLQSSVMTSFCGRNLLAALALLLLPCAIANEVFVSPTGDDFHNNGTEAFPFLSLAAAVKLRPCSIAELHVAQARALQALEVPSGTITVLPGVYATANSSLPLTSCPPALTIRGRAGAAKTEIAAFGGNQGCPRTVLNVQGITCKSSETLACMLPVLQFPNRRRLTSSFCRRPPTSRRVSSPTRPVSAALPISCFSHLLRRRQCDRSRRACRDRKLHVHAHCALRLGVALAQRRGNCG